MQPRNTLGSAISLALLAGTVFGCATAPAPPPQEPTAVGTTTTTESTAVAKQAAAETPVTPEITTSSQAFCDLVCERARIVPRPADAPDYHAQATANANAVIDAMHDDLLACYKKRVAVNPNAHGFITVDIVIDQDGQVRTVETTGGAILGEGTMGCIVKRIKRASFDPPHGGGTLRIHVPFSLRRVEPGDQSL